MIIVLEKNFKYLKVLKIFKCYCHLRQQSVLLLAFLCRHKEIIGISNTDLLNNNEMVELISVKTLM